MGRGWVVCAHAVVVLALAASVSGRSGPGDFALVLSIGDDPDAGVLFDGTTLGGGSGLISATDFSGDTLGSDSRLDLYGGGEIIGPFRIGLIDGSATNVEARVLGGQVAQLDILGGSTVTLDGGTVGDGTVVSSLADLRVFAGSLHVTGGTVIDDTQVWGGDVTIAGGSFGDFFDVLEGADVVVTGGAFERFRVFGEARVSGGSFASGTQVFDGAVAVFIGTEFYLDGQPIAPVEGGPFAITDRAGTLTGTLADGSGFSISLSSIPSADFVSAGADLSVQVLGGCLCEFDGDVSQVGIADLLAYLSLWYAADGQAELDGTSGLGVVDLLTFLECWFPATANGVCG